MAIPDGRILEGKLPVPKLRPIQAWVVIRKDELLADWDFAVKGEMPYKIEPLT